MSPARIARAPGLPLAVTYHYVRPSNSDGVTAIGPAEFEAQLSAIARSHRFASIDEFIALERDGAPAPSARPVCLITFDDALRDQYDFALPALERHGVKAVFFAPMRPFDPDLPALDRWTPQHLLHALAQRLGWTELEARVRSALGPVDIGQERMNTLYHYEVPRKRWLKFALAFAVPAERAAAVLHAINRGDDGSGRAAPRLHATDWFMTSDQLGDLQRRGHALGGHGYDHLPYSTLTPCQQAWDMALSVNLMNSLFGCRPRAIAYPFGRSDDATRALVRSFGYTRAFTTDERTDCKFLDEALARIQPAELAA